MTFADFLRYQYESQVRANLPPIAKHSETQTQTQTNQPQKEAA